MDVELSRAETELQSEEAALHAELSRLAQVSSELAGRLSPIIGEEGFRRLVLLRAT